MDPPKPPTNGMGTAGFVFGILGLFTFGLLAPIGLLFSFLGLFKRPRGFASMGFLMSLLGVTFLSGLFVVPIMSDRHQRAERRYAVEEQMTRDQIKEVVQELRVFMDAKQTKRLDGFDGNAITVQFKDAWENELRYDERPDGFAVRSAGQDQTFDTSDDIVQTFVEAEVSTRGYRGLAL